MASISPTNQLPAARPAPEPRATSPRAPEVRPEGTAARPVPPLPAVGRVAPAPAAAAQAVAKPAQPAPTADELKRVAAEMQRRVSALAPELQFSLDQDSGRPIIRVIDRNTQEVIRQIPAEEKLRLDRALEQFQQGLLVNRKA